MKVGLLVAPMHPYDSYRMMVAIYSVVRTPRSGRTRRWRHCRRMPTPGMRRRAPDVVRTALNLHHICRGGFHLGVGAGEAENLVPFGYDFSTPVAHLEAFLIELRALLDHGVMPSGSSGRVGIPLRRDDLGPPKVWVGAHGPGCCA